ncbi:MAG: hypothetical protein QOF51_2974 [Chloroflexota bacterium]|jgi:2'-5' RNA ligase|nr:hypothetical protein [Chloroflexota bacterium]
MPQLGFAFPLEDDPVHNDVRRLQRAIEQACGMNPALRIVPHLSLKQPFHVRTLEPVEAYFDALAARISPPEVALEGVGTFDDGAVVYLDVRPDPALEALRREVLADLQHEFRVKPQVVEDDRYHFHVTLAQGLDSDQGQRALEAAYELIPAPVYRCRLGVLGLFYYATDVWTPYRRARLGAEHSVPGAR